METVNARVRQSMIGYEDHGILTGVLTCEWDGGVQGFGLTALDRYEAVEGRRVADEACGQWVIGLLKTFGVDHLDAVNGQYCRLLRRGVLIVAVGHIVEDRFLWQDAGEWVVSTQASVVAA